MVNTLPYWPTIHPQHVWEGVLGRDSVNFHMLGHGVLAILAISASKSLPVYQNNKKVISFEVVGNLRILLFVICSRTPGQGFACSSLYSSSFSRVILITDPYSLTVKVSVDFFVSEIDP